MRDPDDEVRVGEVEEESAQRRELLLEEEVEELPEIDRRGEEDFFEGVDVIGAGGSDAVSIQV